MSYKIAEWRINIQKLIVFLYIHNESSKKQIKVLFKKHKGIKYLEISLTKEVWDLYTEN